MVEPLTSDERKAIQIVLTLLTCAIDDDCHDPYANEPPTAAELVMMRQTHPLQQAITLLNSLL